MRAKILKTCGLESSDERPAKVGDTLTVLNVDPQGGHETIQLSNGWWYPESNVEILPVRVGEVVPDIIWNGLVEMGMIKAPTVTKDTNPKDAVGTKKAPMSTVSGPVVMEMGTAMLEGARKYGRHNYRVSKVRASVYYDAAFRHLIAWFEGESVDPDSGMSHITKALASLAVLRDAEINDQLVDDRPPHSKQDWKDNLQSQVDDIFERYPDAKEAHTEN